MPYTFLTATSGLSHLIKRLVAPKQAHSFIIRYGSAFALPTVVFLITWRWFDLERAPFLSLFMISIVVASLIGGRSAGLVATGFSAGLAFLACRPAWTIVLAEPEDGIRIVSFAVVGVMIAILIGMVGELQRELDRERHTVLTTLRSIGDVVITTNRDGIVTFMNGAAEHVTGWRLLEAIGQPVNKIFPVIDESCLEKAINPVHRVLGSGMTAVMPDESLLVRRDGTKVPIHGSAALIRDDNERTIGVVLVCRDISEQKTIRKALIHAEKLASVGKLAATLAHEVNNPLQSTANLLYLVCSASDVDSAKTYAATALNETTRAAHYVHQTLSFAVPPTKRHEVKLCSIVEDVILLHGNKIRAKNAQVLRNYTRSVLVQADAGQMQQMISNLLANALDAIPQGGTLTLRVSKSEGEARFVIADNGSGIAKEHHAKIFQAFFTTKSDVGTGLGLWVTKRIVDSHHGRIRIRSSAGIGTVVRVSLPAVQQDSGNVEQEGNAFRASAMACRTLCTAARPAAI